RDDETGGFLAWGDPGLYDSTTRILEQVAGAGDGFEYEVIPGVTSVQALAAAHRIPLNRIGGAVHAATRAPPRPASREGGRGPRAARPNGGPGWARRHRHRRGDARRRLCVRRPARR